MTTRALIERVVSGKGGGDTGVVLALRHSHRLVVLQSLAKRLDRLLVLTIRDLQSPFPAERVGPSMGRATCSISIRLSRP